MTERIKVQIIDYELDGYILRLDEVLDKTRAAFGTIGPRGMTNAQRQLAAMNLMFGSLDAEQMELVKDPSRLPSINRELRILLGHIPGMRELMRQYFNIKRLERGVTAASVLQGYLAIVVALILTVQTLQARDKKREQELEFLKTTFGDYFTDSDELNVFSLLNRLTELEATIEWVKGWIDIFISKEDIDPLEGMADPPWGD